MHRPSSGQGSEYPGVYRGASLVIVHGACPEGADEPAAAWARNRAGAWAWVTNELHHAD